MKWGIGIRPLKDSKREPFKVKYIHVVHVHSIAGNINIIHVHTCTCIMKFVYSDQSIQGSLLHIDLKLSKEVTSTIKRETSRVKIFVIFTIESPLKKIKSTNTRLSIKR